MSGIIVAPFSNSDIRDWPAGSYAALIDEMLRRADRDVSIRVIGTRSQAIRGCEIVRAFDPARVSNECGKLSWSALTTALRSAACVIGNNSGVAHLAGSFGVPTVCVFGGSHQRIEWRPLGATVVVLSRVIACSPCGLDHGSTCPYDKACLRQIAATTVADAAFAVMRRCGLRLDESAAARRFEPALQIEA